MFAKLWNDEAGVVTIEYLVLGTVIGLGLVIGVSNLEGSINAELTELGNAVMGLSQGYQIDDQSGCKAFKDGSDVDDTPQDAGFGSSGLATGSTIVQDVDIDWCDLDNTPADAEDGE
jgi:Flp pilus assembly pilin Flp